MSNEAPERIRVCVRAGKEDWIGVAYAAETADPSKIHEYIRADLARVDPPAAPPPCAICGHRGMIATVPICTHHDLNAFGRLLSPAAPDERDKALVAEFMSKHHLPLRFTDHLTSVRNRELADDLLAALTTVRAEVWRDAIAAPMEVSC